MKIGDRVILTEDFLTGTRSEIISLKGTKSIICGSTMLNTIHVRLDKTKDGLQDQRYVEKNILRKISVIHNNNNKSIRYLRRNNV